MRASLVQCQNLHHFLSGQVERFHEFTDGTDRIFPAIDVRGMAGAGKHPFPDRPARTPFDRVDLRQCAIRVLLALDQQQWGANRIDSCFDVPVAKLGCEPDIIPALEHGMRMVVVAREPVRQSGRCKVLACHCDCIQCEAFDEHMGGEQDDTGRTVATARVNDCD